ncbi:MAG: hypothetical protein IJ408_03510 [Clostridia bacterium]|nr:hypothetical protein [Clostridia bacterium]
MNDMKKNTKWIVLLVFSLAVMLICGWTFISNYSYAYDESTDGGFFPPSFGVIIYFFFIVIVAMFAAVVVKMIFRKNASVWALLAAAVVLPILCYHLNYHTLKEGAILYPIVNKGGPLHFLAIGDYNFDGMNDEEHHRLYEERKYSSGYGGSPDDTELDGITVEAIGTGGALVSTYADYKEDKNAIHLHLSKKGVTYKEIKLTIDLKNPEDAQKISFYLGGQLNHAVNDDGSVYMIFDESACAGFQSASKDEFIELIIKYAL